MEFLKDLFMCFYTVLKHIFRQRVTVCYPESRTDLPENFRGSIAFDSSKCIGCRTCQRFCPSITPITIDKVIKSINLASCANCGNCAYYCPKGAIYMTKRYELATRDKNELLLTDEFEKG